jgi:hypothetical protein
MPQPGEVFTVLVCEVESLVCEVFGGCRYGCTIITTVFHLCVGAVSWH